MKQYLLDTHILLWAFNEPEKLSKKVQSILQNSANLIYVSAASLWEMRIKEALGKLTLPKHFIQEIKHHALHELPITFEHTEHIPQLPQHHRDPFDRMLIAQALCENITLITHDKLLEKYQTKLLLN